MSWHQAVRFGTVPFAHLKWIPILKSGPLVLELSPRLRWSYPPACARAIPRLRSSYPLACAQG